MEQTNPPLTTMENIGAEMARKLHAVGIHSADDLRRLGSKEAFFRLKAMFPSACLVHLYALQGAIDDIGFDRLSDDVKRDLKQFSDRLKLS